MKSFPGFLMDLALVMGAIAIAMLLVALGLWAAGYPALEVLGWWVRGAVGSRVDLLVALKGACPLILTGLAAGVAFRSGVLNIGAEGQSLLGALGAVAMATRIYVSAPGWLALPLALLAAGLAGALWASIAAILQRYRGVPMVLSTILLNIIAVQVLGILLEGPLKAAGTEVVQSDVLPKAYWLPILDAQSMLHVGILIALAIAAICWVVQSRTAYGFELLVSGLNPTAARLAGMPVTARQFGVMLWSGCFAGIAGALQLMGVEGHSLVSTATSYGYAGIAVALLGRLHPLGIVAAALFFGLLDHGAMAVSFPPHLLPQQVADIVKGLVVIVILIGTVYIARLRTTVRER